ncbi:hypothetical protein Taro_035595 [Colocasia esculenta]|uniref:Bifunctional inhibitor/plant lipid transfer protein/seed storage helical domain-containing protein n=1 Tax=Colocasia esculenta TaxID=4460 RepID=A0A843WDN5_COLES|nr:hypothetical protein [Colocasia esculenta]
MTRRCCFAAAGFLLLVLLAVFHGAAAMACDKSMLLPCETATRTGPTAECCARLLQLQPCFCDLLKDPIVRRSIGTPEAKKVLEICGVVIPRC